MSIYGNACAVGAFGLNLKVVCSSSEPSSPSENTIWVVTDIPCQTWRLHTMETIDWEADIGDISIIYDAADHECINNDQFNVLKRNGIMVTVRGCYQNIDGTASGWKVMDSFCYKAESWFPLILSPIPSFTYTGDYEILTDDDIIAASQTENWKIRFLTSGTLTIQTLNGATDGIDVFCVGGGGGGGSGLDAVASGTGGAGGGGGGGYVTTQKDVQLMRGTDYAIVVGSGGNGGTKEGNGADGGTTSAFGITAKGGGGGKGGSSKGSAGGAGTGAGGKGVTSVGYSGGGAVDGEDGVQEFGETTGKIYFGAGGGGGGGQNTGNDYGQYPQTAAPAVGGKTGGGDGGVANTNDTVTDGQTNTGAGGGGGGNNQQSGYNDFGQPPGGAGGSGIVIIRNARKEETA